LKVLDFILKEACFHSDMHYIPERNGFKLKPYEKAIPGIYFIIDADAKDILKIGKADGKFGLKSRINSYRSNLSKRLQTDKTVKLFHRKMNTNLKNKILKMYIYEMPPLKIKIQSYEVEAQAARSLEALLSLSARKEGHSLELSGQD